MNYSIIELAKIINADIVGNTDKNISQIFFDSRNIINPKNAVFIAIKGLHDGHSFMEEAYNKSIRIFICNHIPFEHKDASYLIVKDPLKALQKWATYHLSQYNIPTIGITGSNGKTIVKEWLYQCTGNQFNIVRSPKSFNSQLGLPLSLLQIEERNNLGVFEVGISKLGEMERQEQVLSPKIGVLTNVLSAHSEYFKNKEELVSEKLKLFNNSEIIIYNNEDAEVEKQISEKYSHKTLISFGGKNADISLLEKKINLNSTLLEVSILGKKQEFEIPFTDEASIENILCLISILYTLNISPNFMQKQFSQLQKVSMRMELIEGINNCLIINDAFNSDFISLEIALNYLQQQNKDKKTLILSDIFQSKIPEKELYNKIAKLINAYSLNSLYLIGENLNKHHALFKTDKKNFLSTEEAIEYLDNYPIENSAILIKGARKFELEKLAAHLERQSHDTILEVNLHSLMHNVNYFKSLLKPKTKMIVMVKASSYGLGSFEIAETLQHYHTDYLAVAIADEGAFLRKKGIYLPIMVMNPEISSYDMVIDNNLEPEIYSFRLLEKFIKKLKEKSISEKYPIHIKIDTGMSRLGFDTQEMEKLGNLLKDNPFVIVKSVFSHFAASDNPSEKEFSKNQAEKLQTSFKKLTSIINYKPMLHICNTCGIVNYPEYHFDAVRLGIGMYGYIDNIKALKNIENVVTLKTVISNLHSINPDTTVGYGRRFKAEKKSVIATLPIGYADGIRRMAGNGKGFVMLNGKKAPIIGSICMDMMMVDVTGISCKEGDSVIVLGESPSLQEYADWYQTIPYEVLTSISPRVKRVFYKE